MKKKLTALILGLFLAVSAVGCGEKPLQNFSVTWFDLFDTVTVIQGYAASQEEWDAQMDALHEDLLAYHQLYDIYNEYEGITNLCTVNARAGQGPVQVDERILNLLELALNISQTTNGQMDVTLGRMLKLWHDARAAADEDPAAAVLPDDEALRSAAEHSGADRIVLNRQDSTVEITDPEVQLDVGSIGKGYAVEMAARAARERGLTSALLNVGGNLRSIGTKPDGTQWTAGIQDPDSDSYRYAVFLQDKALVTSGDYQRYYMVDGVRMHHLIDPDTLYPAKNCRSVSVLAPDSGYADGLSTALFCMDVQEGLDLVNRLDDVEALWLLDNGEACMSNGFADYLRS